jgi:hypothetical protein
MESISFGEFSLALEKALGKHGSQPKQVIKFWDQGGLEDLRACDCHRSVSMMNPTVS